MSEPQEKSSTGTEPKLIEQNKEFYNMKVHKSGQRSATRKSENFCVSQHKVRPNNSANYSKSKYMRKQIVSAVTNYETPFKAVSASRAE